MRFGFLILAFAILCLPAFAGCEKATRSADKPDDRVSASNTSDKSADAGESAASKNTEAQDTVATKGTGTPTPTPQPPAVAPTPPAAGDAAQTELRILHWNIESGGNDPPLIADQLVKLVKAGGYSILGLSEVHEHKVYEEKFRTLGESGQWQSVLGDSGQNNGRESDRLMILFDSSRLKLIESKELNEHGEFTLNTGRHRSPLLAHFEDRISKEQFLVIHNHLARGNAKFRAEQAKGLREFGRDSSIAKIGIGDFNFDFVFETRQGNEGFVEMLRDGVWKWVEPVELIDTNWYDPEPDGVDNYPGSILDFTFVAGEAGNWDVTSKVIVRDGDFLDDENTSDHRPVEVIVRYK